MQLSSINQQAASSHRPEQNRLLSGLSAPVRARLFPCLEMVPLPLGKIIFEPGDSLRYAYFPVDCVVSLRHGMANGESAEIVVVGNEGIVGISLFMGGDSTTSRAVVQSSGTAYRLSGHRLKDEFNLHGELLQLMLCYTQWRITQMTQTAVCSRHHSVWQQLCRWLLHSLDRLDGFDLIMTQELIANILGVRREGITEAAGKLQKLGVIEYRRGRITIKDRPRLEQLSCECYGVVKREADKLLPPPHRH